MRFDWDDERNQNRARTRLARRFDTFALQMETGDIRIYMKDLVLDASAEGLFKKRLHEVARTCVNATSRGKDRLISRNDLYKLFVTVGDKPAKRHYDSTKPFAGEIKQLLDLAYNSYLADALYGYLLTPADSLARIALQEWSSVASNAEEVTAEQLLIWLQRDICPLVQEGVYLKSLQSC